jgi:hypothetical protein
MAARRTVPAALLCTVLAAFTLAACGGSSGNGVESQSATQIVNAALHAAEGAKTVHVFGSVSDGGVPLKLNLEIDGEKGAQGTITDGGLTMTLIRIGDKAYFSGGAALYERYGGSEAANLLKGKWLEAPASSGELAALTPLTNLKSLLGETLKSHGTLQKGSTSTVNGKQAIAVKDTQKGGTLYVATTGVAYPIEIVKSGSSGGKFTFGSWNAHVSLSAPAGAIDIAKLEEQAKS